MSEEKSWACSRPPSQLQAQTQRAPACPRERSCLLSDRYRTKPSHGSITATARRKPVVAEPDLGFQLVWCDYTGYVSGARRELQHGKKRALLPRRHVQTFATREAALAAQARLRAAGGADFVSTVTPVVVRPPTISPALLDDWPLMSKRLTP
jgi:hypothetical protein